MSVGPGAALCQERGRRSPVLGGIWGRFQPQRGGLGGGCSRQGRAERCAQHPALCRSMLPDVVDDFKLQHPESRGHEAIFFSFYVFFTKFTSGVSLGISTLSLE